MQPERVMPHRPSPRSVEDPDAQEKARRLAEQWPKEHRHARGYLEEGEVILITQDMWSRLAFAYTRQDRYCTAEGRHCSCGSTLDVMVVIHDLSQE